MIKILLITNKDDITTDFIVKSLFAKQTPFYRLNTDEIGRSVEMLFDFQRERFELIDQNLNLTINLKEIRSVYFRRPEIQITTKQLSRAEENFIKGENVFALEGLYRILNKAFWLNTVYAIRNAENKIYQLLLARSIKLKTPKSLITNSPEGAWAFYKNISENSIIKPIKSGLVESEEEEGVIFTSRVHLDSNNVERIKLCPTYLQECISKKGDIRVTIVGENIFSTFIDSQE